VVIVTVEASIGVVAAIGCCGRCVSRPVGIAGCRLYCSIVSMCALGVARFCRG
jgi:hypothetical protein